MLLPTLILMVTVDDVIHFHTRFTLYRLNQCDPPVFPDVVDEESFFLSRNEHMVLGHDHLRNRHRSHNRILDCLEILRWVAYVHSIISEDVQVPFRVASNVHESCWIHIQLFGANDL